MVNLREWKIIFGGWPGPWIINEDRVRKFIEINKLNPVSPESFQTGAIAPEASARMSNDPMKSQLNPIFRIDNPKGGMRGPHLHYRGNVYLLDSKQWDKFSGEIIKEFSRKLGEANSVTYGQFVELADVVNGIV
jgi:hypothetical protein